MSLPADRSSARNAVAAAPLGGAPAGAAFRSTDLSTVMLMSA
jgi:hypothetical protein